MKHLISSLIPMSVLLVQPGAIAAPDTEDEMENVIVTGSRLQGSVASLPSHVTVIDRETLDSMPNRTVLDALRHVAGVHVHQFGGRGGVSSVFIRGAEPNFTVVLIDGVQVNDPNDTRGGSFNFATLSLAEVERIEIVRGAQSAIHGSDALAGIINIITRTTSGQSDTSLEAEIGEDGFFRVSANTSGPLGEAAGFSLTASGSDDGDTTPGDEYDDTNLSGRLRLSPGQALTVLLSGRYSDASSRSFPEDSGGPRLAVLRERDVREQEQSSFAALANYQLSTRTTINLRAGYANLDATMRSPGVAPGVRDGVPPSETDTTLDRFTAGIDVTFETSDAVSTAAGISYEDEEGNQTGSLDLAPGFSLPTDFMLDRELASVFAEARFGRSTQGPMALLAVRRDDPSDNDTETSARVGFQYRFEATRVFATWSEGYKLPSFFALGHPLVGNPDLRPESSTSVEVGLSQEMYGDRLDFTLTAFDNEYRDLIDFDPILFTTVNRTEVNNRGFELAAEARMTNDVLVSGHVSYVDIDVSDATVLRQRPDWRGGLSIRWNAASDIDVLADWTYTGESFDSSIPTGGMDLDAYNRLDAELRWQPSPRVTAWFAVDNLLDEEHEEAIGFPSLSRTARAGIRFHL